MRAHLAFFGLALGLVLLPSVSYSKGGYAFGSDNDPDHGLGWAIVSGEDTSMSELSDLDRIEELKHSFGDEFLYIRDGSARYVIQDPDLIGRARKAQESIQLYGREIGIIAGAKAREALASAGFRNRAESKLYRRQATLARRIAEKARRGESTDALERELDAVTRALESLDDEDSRFQMTDSERRELDRRQEEASKRLRKAVREIQDELRDILREAKARHLATRV
jgi:hypothetical protein